jgi:hypothetical protein
MTRTREYQVLFQACTQDGCLLCRLQQESTHRYLDAWKYEHFTDVDLRQQLRHTQGFCHTHTWQLAHMGASLQLALAYREVLSDTIDQLQQQSKTNASTTGNFLRRLLEARTDEMDATSNQIACPACVNRAKAEARYAHSLAQAILDDEFYTRFSHSSGLCLHHFHLTSTLKAATLNGDWRQRLQQAQLTCLQHLDEQLGELIRKHDYRFKDEERGAEMRAWKRAASLVAGEETHL